MFSMNKLFEDAIGHVSRLSDDEQALAADLLHQFTLSRQKPYGLSEDERLAVRQGLAEAERGEFASPSALEATLRAPWR